MSIDLPLDNMTLADKLEAMEALWSDISRKPADLPSPNWHKDILDERRLLSARNAFDVVWFLASHTRFAVKQNNASIVYQRLPKHWSV